MIHFGVHNFLKVLNRPVQLCGEIDLGNIQVNTVIDPSTTLDVNVVNQDAIEVIFNNEMDGFSIDTQVWRTYTKTQDAVFPAGAYYVDIQPLESNKKITINGEDFYLGSRKSGEAKTNLATKEVELVPRIDIISNGGGYIITIAYPSDSGLTNEGMDALYKET